MVDYTFVPEVKYKKLSSTPSTEYRVGDDGSVWSRDIRYGKVRKWRQLKPYTKGMGGYFRIGIPSISTPFVHLIVLTAFRGPRPKGKEGTHFDDDKSNNCLSNLHWRTHKQNLSDRDRNGKTIKGMKHPLAKLTDEDVREIRRWREEGATYLDIRDKFGIQHPAIYGVIHRTTWKHIV